MSAVQGKKHKSETTTQCRKKPDSQDKRQDCDHTMKLDQTKFKTDLPKKI